MLSITRSAFFVGFLLVSQVFAFVPRATNPCASDCAAYTQEASCTTDYTCQCTAKIAGELQTCVNCIVNVGKADPDVITNAQQIVDAYMGLCSGISLPAITVAGTAISPTGTIAGGLTATGVSATTTANTTAKSSSASASAAGSQATNTAPSTSTSGQKSGALSAHRLITVGPHVVVGAIVGMILAVEI